MISRKIKIVLFILPIIGITTYYSCKQNIVPLQDNWESAIPFQEIPEGLSDISAASCGVCHQSHYEEWKLSTHAHAWTDLQFQAELAKESSPYLCINCHIPLENQQEFIIEGLRNGDIYNPVKKKNPNFDEKLQLEGISCSTCHVRNGHIIGSIGSDKAPHPVKKDPEFLNETLCISCHNANAVVTPELVCTFQTGEEWKAGPYYPEKNCISCHMDTITRPLMPGMDNRLSHRHWFAGSGIPKRKGVEAVALQGMAFYPGTLDQEIKAGEEISFTLTLKNEFAGHRLPSGDPERFYLIDLIIKDAETNSLLAEHNGRIGEKWEWYPEAKKIDDNNLNPKESRDYTISYRTEKVGEIILEAKVTKHRMDEATAEYNGLGEEYPIMIPVFEYTQEIKVKDL